MKQIIDFIDNEDFLLANKDKEFTTIEKVALVVNNCSETLKDKFEYLLSLNYEQDQDLKEKVNKWIERKKEELDEIKNIDSKDIVFSVCLERKDANSKLFHTFSEAMNAIKGRAYIAIKKINDTSHFSRCGSVELNQDKEIIDCGYIDRNKEHKKPIFDNLYVSLNNPYKPFDLIEVPYYTKYLIVANDNALTEKLKAEAEDSAKSRTKGYLDTNIPFYSFPNGWELDPNTEVNIFNNVNVPISLIKKIDKRDITLGQQEYIDNLKNIIKKNNGYIK